MNKNQIQTEEQYLSVQFESLPLEVQRHLINIARELSKAREKHPDWPHDHIHCAAIVVEEAGELIQAAIQHRYEEGDIHNLTKEAIQTGATCVRFLLHLSEGGML